MMQAVIQRLLVRLLKFLLRRYCRPFGLRWSRLTEFKDVLISEGDRQGWFNVIKKIANSLVVMLVDRKFAPDKEEIKGRYRYCLSKCAICPRKYNPKTKRFEGKAVCRNGVAGCGCYCAYKVMSPAACWGWPYAFGWAMSRALKVWRAIHGNDEESGV